MTYNTCRLCKDDDLRRPTFRYGIRHYCHAECGLEKWGSEFIAKIPRWQVGQIPFMALENYPEAHDRALEIINDREQ